MSEELTSQEHSQALSPVADTPVADTPLQALEKQQIAVDIQTDHPDAPEAEAIEIPSEFVKSPPLEKAAKAPETKDNTKKKRFPDSFKPKDVYGRLSQSPQVLKAYLKEVKTLDQAIALEGLGVALTHLVSHGQHKRKKQLLFDLSQWVFNEMKLKGKRKHQLLESIVYGSPSFHMEATEAVTYYLNQIQEEARS